MNQAEHDAAVQVLLDRTDRILKILDGNGRPGLVSELAALKQEVAEVKESLPSTREKTSMKLGGGAGAAAFLVWFFSEVWPSIQKAIQGG